ncbi:hypothetical protein [Goodfellowiella coeruleoviolacea]|uniref:Uncharacterized protein n=1 Tax=Goodfellowiella coeruleoviolacea TaxID=334858 RepID=A0AAE3GB88_9PSEU|nr:hypothetical protein [Goodfellowiella coeruleoviolacea]MCP2163889.1 hypothetical protein [Goodfellowiella coeruleoviolacea]
MRNRIRRGRGTGLPGRIAIGLLTLALTLTGAATASADPTGRGSGDDVGAALTLTYNLSGSSYVKKTDSSMALGPGTLTTTIDLATGNLSGELSMPSAQASFAVLGIPVTAQVDMVPVGPATGTLVRGVVNATAEVYIRLSNVRMGGLPILTGPHCQTRTPAVIPLVSGPNFNPLQGGDLTGAYTIPEFDNCLLTGLLINQLVPGPDNTITLTLHRATS